MFRLSTRVDPLAQKNVINVDRHNVLDSLMRLFAKEKFRPEALLDVKFSGEDAYDAGGPMRELMRLAMQDIRQMVLFEGPANERQLTLDYDGKMSQCFVPKRSMQVFSVVRVTLVSRCYTI